MNSPAMKAIRQIILDSTEDELREAVGDEAFQRLADAGRAAAAKALQNRYRIIEDIGSNPDRHGRQ